MAGTPTQYYGFPTYADSDAVDLTAQYNTAVTNIDSEIHQLSIAPARKRKPGVVIIGDSWSDPNNGDTWKAAFQERFDCTLYNYAESGARAFVGTESGTTSFTDQLAKAVSELNPDDVDYVLIVGGVNDLDKPLSKAGEGYGNQARYFNGLLSMADNASVQFGGVPAYVIPNAYNSTHGDDNPYSTQYLTNMFGAYHNMANTCEYIFFDLILYLCTNPDAFDSSNLHLTATGYRSMGRIIANLLHGRRYGAWVSPVSCPLTEDTGIGVSARDGVVRIRYRFQPSEKTTGSVEYYDGTSPIAYKLNAIFVPPSTGYSQSSAAGSIYIQTRGAFNETTALVKVERTAGDLPSNTTMFQ